MLCNFQNSISQSQSQDQNLDTSTKTGSKLRINSKIKLVIGSLAIFAGSFVGLGVLVALGLGAMGTLSQIASYGINRYVQIKEAYKEGLKLYQEALNLYVDEMQSQTWDNTISSLNDPMYKRTYNAIKMELWETFRDLSLQNEYQVSPGTKNLALTQEGLKKLNKIAPIIDVEFATDESYLADNEEVFELMNEQIESYDPTKEDSLKYTVGEIADQAGVDRELAEKVIFWGLYKMSRDSDKAQSDFQKYFSKKESFGTADDGTPILVGYTKDQCIRYTFRFTGAPGETALKSAYLPIDTSRISAQEIVREMYQLNPIVDVQLIVKGRTIVCGAIVGDSLMGTVEITSTTTLSEIARALDLTEKDSITVMGVQKGEGKKKGDKIVKKDTSFKDILSYVKDIDDDKDIDYNKVKEKIVDLNLERNQKKKYNTLELFEDLRLETQKFSELLAQIFPERLSRYSDRDLSRFWKEKNFMYIARVLNKIVNPKNHDYKPDFKFPDSNAGLKLLESNIIENLKVKGLGCLKLIEFYRDNKLTTLQFIELIERELGRVSGDIEFTDTEMSLLLAGYKEFIRNIKDTLTNSKSKRNYNPFFKLSQEQINEFKKIYTQFMGYQAQKCLKYLNIYYIVNELPSRPEYNDISNERFFENINSQLKAYWFGFLCADGSISLKRSRISFELAVKDKDRVYALASTLGLDFRRIKFLNRRYFYNGQFKTLQSCGIKFSSKLMKDDLINNDFLSLKVNKKGLPYFIVERILLSKSEAIQYNIHWPNTYSGKIALAWLLGYFDGDGTYMGKYKGGQSGKIYSSNKLVLNDIKKYFDIKNNVYPCKNIDDNNLVITDLTAKESGQLYFLTLGPEIYSAMINSYKYSMLRKRPIMQIQDLSNYLGNK